MRELPYHAVPPRLIEKNGLTHQHPGVTADSKIIRSLCNLPNSPCICSKLPFLAINDGVQDLKY